MKRFEYLSVVMALTLSFGTSALAEEAAPSAATEEPAAGAERGARLAVEETEHPAEPSPVAPVLPIELSGYVDVSYAVSKSKDEEATNGFSFDKFKLEAQKHWDNVGLRADVAFGVGGLHIDQGYAHAEWSGQTVRLGRFYAPIGFEVVDARDMYQYSHAAVFTYGLPSFWTGASIAGTPTDMLDYVVYLGNGWDSNSDNNAAKGIGARMGITPSEGVNIGVSPLLSMEQSNDVFTDVAEQKYPRIVVDLDATVKTVENLTIGFEFLYGMEKFNAAALDATKEVEENNSWMGGLLMAHYDYADWGGVTFRGDYFADSAKNAGGTRLGMGTDASQIGLTLAPTFVITDRAGIVIEGKYTIYGGEDKGTDSNPTAAGVQPTEIDSNNLTGAIEATYSF